MTIYPNDIRFTEYNLKLKVFFEHVLASDLINKGFIDFKMFLEKCPASELTRKQIVFFLLQFNTKWQKR